MQDISRDASRDVSADASEGRWMTYAELAQLRGIDKQSAARLTFRRRWRRQKSHPLGDALQLNDRIAHLHHAGQRLPQLGIALPGR